MASKNETKGSGRRSKSPRQTSASSPSPTATTSPSVSCPTGGATITFGSIDPSSFPSSPPTTTTTTQHLPSPPAPPLPLPVQETRQEFISCTAEGTTTTDLPSPSTAPSESAGSRRTPTYLPIIKEYSSLIAPAVACAMTTLRRAKEVDPIDLQELIVGLLGLQLGDMESVLGSLLGLAEMMNGNAELKVAFEALFDMEGLTSAIKLTETILAERKKRHGSGGSCGGSKGGGGSGEGDGEGGGVAA